VFSPDLGFYKYQEVNTLTFAANIKGDYNGSNIGRTRWRISA
jgi:hypothetical protein